MIWHILTLFPRENKKNRQFQNVSKVICISLFKGNCAPLWWGNGIQKSIRDGYSSVPAEAFYSQNVLLLTYSKVPFIFLDFFKNILFFYLFLSFFSRKPCLRVNSCCNMLSWAARKMGCRSVWSSPHQFAFLCFALWFCDLNIVVLGCSWNTLQSILEVNLWPDSEVNCICTRFLKAN